MGAKALFSTPIHSIPDSFMEIIENYLGNNLSTANAHGNLKASGKKIREDHRI